MNWLGYFCRSWGIKVVLVFIAALPGTAVCLLIAASVDNFIVTFFAGAAGTITFLCGYQYLGDWYQRVMRWIVKRCGGYVIVCDNDAIGNLKIDWCEANAKGFWLCFSDSLPRGFTDAHLCDDFEFLFGSASDAVHFKLRWHEADVTI